MILSTALPLCWATVNMIAQYVGQKLSKASKLDWFSATVSKLVNYQKTADCAQQEANMHSWMKRTHVLSGCLVGWNKGISRGLLLTQSKVIYIQYSLSHPASLPLW